MLIAFFLGWVAGVALQLQQAALWPLWAYGLCAFGALIVNVLLILTNLAQRTQMRIQNQWQRLLRLLRLLCAFGAAGLLAYASTGGRALWFEQTILNPALEGVDVEVVGIIPNMPQRLETGLRFRLELESAHVNARAVTMPPKIMLTWYQRSNYADHNSRNDDQMVSAGIADVDAAPRTPRAGERWLFTVRLKAPHGNANPHGFDYELWAWEQGVQATGYVRDNPKQTPPRRLGMQAWQPFYALERARQSVRDAVFARWDSKVDANRAQQGAAGVLAALITGDQNALERADWDVFRATGVAHLMSISGLHITMFAWMAAGLVGWLWRRRSRWCLWLPASHAGLWGGLLLATLYAGFSGWGVPAQRTIWMLATFSLLRASGLRWPWYAAWLLAATVVLVADPWALLQAGFWLSFVAVAVLFASDAPQPSPAAKRSAAQTPLVLPTTPLITPPAKASRAWRMLREQLVITLALAPLTLLLFQQVSLVGLVANALAIPVVTLLVTPLAMLGVALPMLWDAAAWCLMGLSNVLVWLAAWPWATYSHAAVPWPLAGLSVLGGLLLVLLVIPLPWKRRLLWAGLGVLCCMPALLWQPSRPAAGQFDLLAIDIGQGNSVLVRTASKSLLFDAGPRFSKESDAGHRSIVPLLRAQGERLDALVLSHRDSDHTGGARAVLAAHPQAQLISSVVQPQELLQLGLPTNVTPCAKGMTWDWDGVRLEFLHPKQQNESNRQDVAFQPLQARTKPNALSCVLKISTKVASALLSADIEAAQEEILVTEQADKLPSTILLVPHHGSLTSSTPAFLDAVQPRIAWVQAGYRNRFAHPRPQVMARYQVRGIRVYESSNCGAAQWDSAAPTVVTCQRELAPRYWHHQSQRQTHHQSLQQTVRQVLR